MIYTYCVVKVESNFSFTVSVSGFSLCHAKDTIITSRISVVGTISISSESLCGCHYGDTYRTGKNLKDVFEYFGVFLCLSVEYSQVLNTHVAL